MIRSICSYDGWVKAIMAANRKLFARGGRSTCLWAALLALAPGCTHWNLWGDPFPKEVQEMTHNIRPRDPEGDPAGLSTKARQIESNLGVSR